ncbi:MAG TPA: hypothetical protein DIT67_01895 [Octadecabacter sp.]|nr:hypothetical protein [Octadecabacter sp.]
MTVVKPISIVLTAASRAMSFLRSRYACLVDHELDRHLLTESEREDENMLNRVRSAFYEA